MSFDCREHLRVALEPPPILRRSLQETIIKQKLQPTPAATITISIGEYYALLITAALSTTVALFFTFSRIQQSWVDAGSTSEQINERQSGRRCEPSNRYENPSSLPRSRKFNEKGVDFITVALIVFYMVKVARSTRRRKHSKDWSASHARLPSRLAVAHCTDKKKSIPSVNALSNDHSFDEADTHKSWSGSEESNVPPSDNISDNMILDDQSAEHTPRNVMLCLLLLLLGLEYMRYL